MKPKTTSEVIRVLKLEIKTWKSRWGNDNPVMRHTIACLQRAGSIVRLWSAGITPADVRAAERKRKGRAK